MRIFGYEELGKTQKWFCSPLLLHTKHFLWFDSIYTLFLFFPPGKNFQLDFQVRWPWISQKSETRGGFPISGLLDLRKHKTKSKNSISPISWGSYADWSLRNTRYRLHNKVTHNSLSHTLALETHTLSRHTTCLMLKCMSNAVPTFHFHPPSGLSFDRREEFPFPCSWLPTDSFTISCQGGASD